MIALPAPDAPATAEPAFMERLRLRARRQALWLRAQWAGAIPTQGLAISHEEVDRLLADPSAAIDARARFLAGDAESRQLAEPVRSADERSARDPALARLVRLLDLSGAETDLLTLAAAVEIDPGLRRAVAYLHDDAAASWPTPFLASQLFDWPPGTRPGADSALVRWLLAAPLDGVGPQWSATTPWVPDAHAVRLLLGNDPLDPALAARVIAPAEAAPECLHPAARDAIVAFVRATLPGGAVEIELIGPEGSGRRTLAAQCCAALGLPLVVLEAGKLVDGGVTRAARSARLLGAATYVDAADAADGGLARSLCGAVKLGFLGTRAPAGGLRAGVARKTVRLARLTRGGRARLWSALSSAPLPPVIADWTLLPADIAAAARAAPAGDDAVVEACRATPSVVGQLVTPLPRPFGWDDIVLPAGVRRHLAEIEAQARLRWPVYEEWGFERLCSLGRGIAALFAGPSGTGKTMAAQVLGRVLGMEVYRVDLAGVMSKYIGETEKNLRQIFDACERANVLLFFDEADALFGQRMQIKDAHDRFANIEIDYLLQRMEQYEGLAILATNRKGEIDTAFLRRVRFIVDFTPPGPAERQILWQRALGPAGEPLLDPAIDWGFLARSLDMTGADIKGAALGAAFLARSGGGRIGMRQILWAARREMAKRGVVLRLPGEEAP